MRSRSCDFSSQANQPVFDYHYSGIGRAISHSYSKRGAKVCVVSRKAEALEKVKEECVALRLSAAEDGVITVVADFAEAADMVRVRDTLEKGV